jgi:hypothetical protein
MLGGVFHILCWPVLLCIAGSIALDISGMALSAPLTELLVEANNASGIRLLLPEPKYDKQSIELSDVFVVGNSLSPAAPLVSGRPILLSPD